MKLSIVTLGSLIGLSLIQAQVPSPYYPPPPYDPSPIAPFLPPPPTPYPAVTPYPATPYPATYPTAPIPMPRVPIVPPIPVPVPTPLKVNPPAMETLTRQIPVMSVPVSSEPLKSRVFEIHDIICPASVHVNSQTNAESLMKLIVAVVKPKTWERNGGKGKVQYIQESDSICLTNTPTVLNAVAEMLDGLRKEQDQVIVEMQIVSVTDGYAAKAGWPTDGKAKNFKHDDVLKALKTTKGDNRIDMLSAPKLTMLDGQMGRVFIGQEQAPLIPVTSQAQAKTDFVPTAPKNEQSVVAAMKKGKLPMLSEMEIAFAEPEVEAAMDNNLTPTERDALLDSARQKYQRALKADPKNTTAMLGLARIFTVSNNKEKAVEYYREAMKHSPKDHKLAFCMSCMYMYFEDWLNAIELARTALAMDPDNLQYPRAIALFTARSGNFQKAYESLLQTRMSEADARFFLGRLLIDMDRTEEGQQQMILVLKSKPQHEGARYALAKLQSLEKKPNTQLAGYQQELTQVKNESVQNRSIDVKCTPTIMLDGKSVRMNVTTALKNPNLEISTAYVIPDGDCIVTYLGSIDSTKITTPAMTTGPITNTWEKPKCNYYQVIRVKIMREEDQANECRTPILHPIRKDMPAPKCEEVPSDEEVLRALPDSIRGVPTVYEVFRDDVTIVKNRIVDKIDPPRMFPLVGAAQLHHCHWECKIYYNELVQTNYPFLTYIKKPQVKVVHIDKDHLHLYEVPNVDPKQVQVNVNGKLFTFNVGWIGGQ